jgi:hypothetical protein
MAKIVSISRKSEEATISLPSKSQSPSLNSTPRLLLHFFRNDLLKVFSRSPSGKAWKAAATNLNASLRSRRS